MSSTQPATTETLSLPEECSIYSIRSIHQQFTESLGSAEELTLDFSNVEKVDACFLQLLYSLNNTAMLKGVDLTLEGVPDDLINLSERIHVPVPSLQPLAEE